jgi:hypothetical protein
MSWSKGLSYFAAAALLWLIIAGCWKTFELIRPGIPEPAVVAVAPSGNGIVTQAKDSSKVTVDFAKRRVTAGGQTLQAYPDGQVDIVASLNQSNEDLRAKLRQVKDQLAAARTYQDSTDIYRAMLAGAQAFTEARQLWTGITRSTWGFCLRPGIAVAYGYDFTAHTWDWEPLGRLKYLWWRNATFSAMIGPRAGYPVVFGYHLFHSAEVVAGPGITWDRHPVLKLGLAGDI